MRKFALLGAIGALWAVSAVAADSADTLQIRGFTIEYGHVGLAKLQKMQATLEHQIDIVEQSGVPAGTLEFFRSVPVVMEKHIDTGFGHAGMIDGRQVVQLEAEKLPRDRPILLHELLHAYQGVKLGPTPIIRDAYQQAVQMGLYKQYARAHFLENPREFFAVIGSIYLYGRKIDQPPFDCRLPARLQPQFVAFLGEQFGPHPCK